MSAESQRKIASQILLYTEALRVLRPSMHWLQQEEIQSSAGRWPPSYAKCHLRVHGHQTREIRMRVKKTGGHSDTHQYTPWILCPARLQHQDNAMEVAHVPAETQGGIQGDPRGTQGDSKGPEDPKGPEGEPRGPKGRTQGDPRETQTQGGPKGTPGGTQGDPRGSVYLMLGKEYTQLAQRHKLL